MENLNKILRWLKKPRKVKSHIICSTCHGLGETYHTELVYMGTFISREVEGTRQICFRCSGNKFIPNPEWPKYQEKLNNWENQK